VDLRFLIFPAVLGLVVVVFLSMLPSTETSTANATGTSPEEIYKPNATTASTTHTTIPQVPSSCVVLKAAKDVFARSEPITFRLVNNCTEDIILPNSAPWTIRDSSGRVVFSPVSLQVVTRIEPGSFKEWSWNQRDSYGRSVEPGTYYITVETSNRGSFTVVVKIEG